MEDIHHLRRAVRCRGCLVFVFFPETCGKTLEEVELMFSKDGPRPWNTRKGESRLEAEIEAVIARKMQEPVVETHKVTEKV